MITSAWVGKGVKAVRALVAALLIVLYIKEARSLLLVGIFTSSLLSSLRISAARSTWDIFFESATDRAFALLCFFLLILMGSCSPLFLGFLITVSLVQMTVSGYFQWQGLSMPPLPSPLIRRVQLLQWGWIGAISVLTQVQILRPETSSILYPVEGMGYLILAGCHAYLFYCYSVRFQPYLWTDLRRLGVGRQSAA